MKYSLVFTASYNKRAVKFLKKHPELKKQYLKTLQLLELNPHHPSLRLHALGGRLTGLHSVSINISYRLTMEFIVDVDEIIPVNVGTHDEVYRQ
ncbi:plasmid stabilization protein [Mariprofundus sp. EBB-1]|uniref:type II toxin-antitoxin system RelE/ParE family toxin n=1 Tax=Mariprofundus sp. EBB-1 TaxID=2650971 RepID=UPI000EF1AF72|nr:plasmid stabilization protein [Mariprofundus sp. EBB-1]RLL49769.1 plasmid stabilization protein [Mariprofundus sp. EBB-1]